MIAYHKSFIEKPMIAKIVSDINITKILECNNSLRRPIIGCILGIKVEHLELSNINVPQNYMELYKEYFILNETIPYDIAYFTGGHTILWDPCDRALGGSEQAVVLLSESWARNNIRVIVYGNFKEEKTVNGVKYSYWYNFPYEKKIKTLIVWRHCGLLLMLTFLIRSNISNMIIDFHDNFSYTMGQMDKNKLQEFLNSANHINVKSNYHKQSLLEFFNNNITTNINVIMNGIRINSFKDSMSKYCIRNPYRFCYCSSYDRGLEIILTKIWPHIYRMNNMAELHVYYGMEHLDTNSKEKIRLLLGQEGVMDHGRQPLETIIKEKYMSTFHLYLNNSIAEIDCISIRESLVTGCIPIISNYGVFKERHGLVYNFNSSNDNILEAIAQDIVKKMGDDNFIETSQNELKKSDTIISWEQVATVWTDICKL
jgi:hypothetical protein